MAHDVAVTLVKDVFEHTRRNLFHKESVGQALKIHEAEAKASLYFHKESEKLSQAQHAQDLLQSQYFHEEEIDLEKRVAIRENIHDDLAYSNMESEAMLVMVTLVLSIDFAMLIEGLLPASAYATFVVAYYLSLGCSLDLLTTSAWCMLVFRERMRGYIDKMKDSLRRQSQADQDYRKTESYADVTIPEKLYPADAGRKAKDDLIYKYDPENSGGGVRTTSTASAASTVSFIAEYDASANRRFVDFGDHVCDWGFSVGKACTGFVGSKQTPLEAPDIQAGTQRMLSFSATQDETPVGQDETPYQTPRSQQTYETPRSRSEQPTPQSPRSLPEVSPLSMHVGLSEKERETEYKRNVERRNHEWHLTQDALGKYRELDCDPWRAAADSFAFGGVVMLMVAACFLQLGNSYVNEAPLPNSDAEFPTSKLAVWCFVVPSILTMLFITIVHFRYSISGKAQVWRQLQDAMRVNADKIAELKTHHADTFRNLGLQAEAWINIPPDTLWSKARGQWYIDQLEGAAEGDDGKFYASVIAFKDSVSKFKGCVQESSTEKSHAAGVLFSCLGYKCILPKYFSLDVLGDPDEWIVRSSKTCLRLLVALPLVTLLVFFLVMSFVGMDFAGFAVENGELQRPSIALTQYKLATESSWPAFWEPSSAAWIPERNALVLVGGGRFLEAIFQDEIMRLSPLTGFDIPGAASIVDLCIAGARTGRWTVAIDKDSGVHVTNSSGAGHLQWHQLGSFHHSTKRKLTLSHKRSAVAVACRAVGADIELWHSETKGNEAVLLGTKLSALSSASMKVQLLNSSFLWRSTWLLDDDVIASWLKDGKYRSSVISIQSAEVTPSGGLLLLVTIVGRSSSEEDLLQVLAVIDAHGQLRESLSLPIPDEVRGGWAAIACRSAEMSDKEELSTLFLVAGGQTPIVATVKMDASKYRL